MVECNFEDTLGGKVLTKIILTVEKPTKKFPVKKHTIEDLNFLTA